MKDIQGKAAFITGGASGIGLGIATAVASAGMKVMLADLREDSLAEAARTLSAKGADVETVVVDVSDRSAMAAAAQATVDRFGPVELVVANAAVGMIGRVRDASFDDWDWSNSVNIGGVVNAIQSFLPILRQQGHGHFAATSSMAGINPLPHGGLYSVQKAAVMAMMEALCAELADEAVEISVICPGMTRTNARETMKLRPERYADHGIRVSMPSAPPPDAPPMPNPMDFAMDPLELGQRVLRGLLAGDLYILTHAEFEDEIRDGFETILAAMPSDRFPAPPPGASSPPGMNFGVYANALARRKAAAS